jgi:hypothetical protein
MSRNNSRGVSLTPRKLNQLVRSYLYRKKLADTLESLQLELLAVTQIEFRVVNQSSKNEDVFANGETDTCYLIPDSYSTSRTTRKPRLPSLAPGGPLPRSDDRMPHGLLPQHPPRRTRPSPDDGPWGSRRGEPL